jgi:hypothetical protein
VAVAEVLAAASVEVMEEDSAEVLVEVLAAVEDFLVASEEHLWDTTKVTGGGGRCQAAMAEETGTDGGTE